MGWQRGGKKAAKAGDMAAKDVAAMAGANAKEKGEIGLDGSQRCQGNTADGTTKGRNAGTTWRGSAKAHTHTRCQYLD